MKKCRWCLVEKEEGDFWKCKTGRGGLRPRCKRCLYDDQRALVKRQGGYYKPYTSREAQVNKEYLRSFKGKAQKMYSQMRTRLKHGHPTYRTLSCDFSRAEFYQFLPQTDYEQIYSNWKLMEFDRRYAPSINRIDNTKGYTLSNIEIITLQENWNRR